MAFSVLFGTSRQAKPIVFYQGGNISAQVFPQLVELTYCDRASNMEDTIDIELADPDHRFQNTWTFARAQPLNVTLEQDSWNSPGEIIQQQCGQFEIDMIELEGPPSTIRIRAKSVPVSGSLKFQQKSRAWEGTDLKTVAQQIAGESGMSLNYQAALNPTFSRLDQREQSDLVVLSREADRFGLCVKVANNQIVIFDEQTAESQAATFTVLAPTRTSPGGINNSGILKWRLTANSNEVVNAATVTYRNPETGRTINQTFTPPTSPTKSVSGAKDIDSSRVDIQSADTPQGDN
jgi:phage protein D